MTSAISLEMYNNIYDEFKDECAKIAAACEEEGYPSNGANYDLRVEELKKSPYYAVLFEDDDDDDDNCEYLDDYIGDEDSSPVGVVPREPVMVEKPYDDIDYYEWRSIYAHELKKIADELAKCANYTLNLHVEYAVEEDDVTIDIKRVFRDTQNDALDKLIALAKDKLAAIEKVTARF